MKHLPHYFLALLWLGALIYAPQITGDQMWWILGVGTALGIAWKM